MGILFFILMYVICLIALYHILFCRYNVKYNTKTNEYEEILTKSKIPLYLIIMCCITWFIPIANLSLLIGLIFDALNDNVKYESFLTKCY